MTLAMYSTSPEDINARPQVSPVFCATAVSSAWIGA